jgi:protein farnesyltransferase/geranylgeranyltransferase type-1 subunit alpha
MDFNTKEYNDLIPLLQEDGPSPLVPIMYDPDYAVAMKYCRALIQKNEYSTRALLVTTEILTQNASHYSVWY